MKNSAFDTPAVRAVFKQQASDFQVSEVLGFEPAGEGEHLWLRISKTGLTTEAVVSDLARQLQLSRKQIAYSGLKDKQAVTEQWFSVPWPIKREQPVVGGDNWRVLQATRHVKKLRRGVHAENAFDIVLRDLEGDTAMLEQRLQAVAERGVPNYFGDQRFGRDHGNIEQALAMFAGRRCKAFQRSIYLSAARACLFNDYLTRRVADGNWDQPLSGDIFNLDASNAQFGPEAVSDAIVQRMQVQDIHASGPLAGTGDTGLQADAAEYFADTVAAHPLLYQGLLQSGVQSALRPLRSRVKSLNWIINNNECRLQFRLRSGAYATAVVRELVMADGVS